MKKLAASLIFILVAFFIADIVVGIAMQWLYDNTEHEYVTKTRYLAGHVDKDVILLGTSRTSHHYIPSILEDSLGMNIYNGGMDGTDNIYMHYFLLNLILRHHTPKVVCLELSTHDYCTPEDSYKPLGRLAPYIGMSKDNDSIFRQAVSYWPYRISVTYRYNATVISSIGGFFMHQHRSGKTGYDPLPSPKTLPEPSDESTTKGTIDQKKIYYINKFIALCKQRGIMLVFSTSPRLSKVPADLYDPLKRVATENGIPYFEYHTKGLFLNHPEYFRDTGHLCDKGARAYTPIFAHDLKEYLNKEGMVK